MSKTGRPPKGIGHVDALTGPEQEKARLRVILRTISGDLTVGEACRELGVSEARLHGLRHQALQGALDGLLPGRPGPPRIEEPEEARQVRRLEERVEELDLDLEIAEVRAEVALAVPQAVAGKKNDLGAKTRRGKRKRKKRKKTKHRR